MAEDFPNYYDDPRPWWEVRLGGVLLECPLVAIDGIEIEDEYNVQRPIGQSGAVAVFKGTKLVEGITLSFEGENRASFSALRGLWDLLAPKPGTGGGTGTTAGSQYTAAASSPNGTTTPTAPTAPASTLPATGTGGTGSTASGDGWPKNSSASPYPGPKPPTLTIDNPLLAWIGVVAVSRKKWKGPYWREGAGSWRVDVTFIQSKPPTPANVGAQSPAKGAAFTGGAPNQAADSAAKADAAAKASPV